MEMRQLRHGCSQSCVQSNENEPWPIDSLEKQQLQNFHAQNGLLVWTRHLWWMSLFAWGSWRLTVSSIWTLQSPWVLTTNWEKVFLVKSISTFNPSLSTVSGSGCEKALQHTYLHFVPERLCGGTVGSPSASTSAIAVADASQSNGCGHLSRAPCNSNI